MEEQHDPQRRFDQTWQRFKAQSERVAKTSFIGEVVTVSTQRRNESLFATLVITQGRNAGDEISARIPYAKARFAKAPTADGPGWVEVGQVLKLTGTLLRYDGAPRFDTAFLTWVEEPGPHERDRRSNVQLLTGNPDRSFEYADRFRIAEHQGPLDSIVLIASRGSRGQQDFTRQINRDCPPSRRINITYRDVPVQGAEMVEQICQVLYRLTPDQADMAVIARGGGGWSDLREFDDLLLAEAIRDCAIPVVTAIGHEEDRHLVDIAAKFAFDVPAAAAIELRQGKAIAMARAAKRRGEEQRNRVARPVPSAPLPASPPPTTLGKRHESPLPVHGPPVIRAAWNPLPSAPRGPQRWRAPLDKVSMLALVAALTCLGPVALGLGLAGLYRTRGQRRRGRWAAAFATILGAVWTVPMITAGFGFVEATRMQPGACVEATDTWSQAAGSLVDCSQVHLGEVVYRGAADPATMQSVRRGNQANRCLQELSPRTRRILERRRFALRIVFADEVQRVGEDFVCIAVAPNPERRSLLERPTR